MGRIVESRGVVRRSPYDREILSLAVPALGALAAEPLYVLVDTAIVGHLGHAAARGARDRGHAAQLELLDLQLPRLRDDRAGRPLGRRRAGGDGRPPGGAGAVARGRDRVPRGGGDRGARPGRRDPDGRARADRRTWRPPTCGSRSIGLRPCALIALAGQGYLRGVSNLRLPLIVVVVSNAVNVVLELLFVYGFDWGLAGLGVGHRHGPGRDGGPPSSSRCCARRRRTGGRAWRSCAR